jgi:hypothetical protein
VFRRDELVELTVTLGPVVEDAVWLEADPEAPPAARAAFEAWSAGRWPGAG